MAEDGVNKGSLWRPATLESLGKFAALVGMLLPVTGALNRELAFLLGGRVPLGVGSSLPVPQLASLGLLVMLPGLIAGLLLAWLVRRPFRFQWLSLPRTAGLSLSRKVLALGAYVAGLVIAAYAVVLMLSASIQVSSKSVSGLLGSIVAAVVIWWSSRLAGTHEKLPVARLLPVVFAVTAITAVSSGVGPTTAGTYIATVTFQSDAGLTDGTYSVLGEDGDTTWLLSCDVGATPLRVRSALIKAMALKPFGPNVRERTLDETLTAGLGPGFVQRCP